MVQRKISTLKYFVRRRHCAILMIVGSMLLVVATWQLAIIGEKVFLPYSSANDLEHFRRNRSLKFYQDNTQVIIEPATLPCESLEEVPVIVLVTSATSHRAHRDAIRDTWAQHLKTYFFLGLDGTNIDESLVETYMEARQYSDMVVFDFQDHYQNLTLKTAFMLDWSLKKCPQAEFVFKTDDDVIVNPWTLKQVLEDNVDNEIIGYKLTNHTVHRERWSKWHVPRWLLPSDLVEEYLSGTGYLISGDYLNQILKAANEIPLINLEDIFFTYLVSKRNLSLTLSHESRLSPTKPLLSLPCDYWSLASAHSFGPEEMVAAWKKLEDLGQRFDGKEEVCDSLRKAADMSLVPIRWLEKTARVVGSFASIAVRPSF